jgi:hypothetical protein
MVTTIAVVAATAGLPGPRRAGMGKRIDVTALEPVIGTTYPPPFDEPCRARASATPLA